MFLWKLTGTLTRNARYGIMMLMRTTLTLNDDVLRLARRKAARENRSLKDVINESLRLGLTLGEERSGEKYVFHLKTVQGRMMQGVDLHDRDKLFDLLNGR
jgi:hypothetical protein